MGNLIQDDYRLLHLEDTELKPFDDSGKLRDMNNRVKAMIRHQQDVHRGWEFLRKQMEDYRKVIRKEIIVDSIPVLLMYNPTRRPSLNAVPLHSAQFRDRYASCFLCHLKPGQRGVLLLNGKYFATPNPGVTIPGDLTILYKEHLPQLLFNRYDDMIRLAYELYDFSVFFNGILCGASSPHLHFQAGFKNELPGEIQIKTLISGAQVGKAYAETLYKREDSSVYTLESYLRSVFVVRTKDRDFLSWFFELFYTELIEVDRHIKGMADIPDFGGFIASIDRQETEGRFNCFLGYSSEEGFLALFFPKRTNRPKLYFHPDSEKRIVVGMAIKEALGCLITGREKDFRKLSESPSLIREIYQDTSITNEMHKELRERLRGQLSG